MSGHVFGHYTVSRVRWESEYESDPIEEHGWLDRQWSTTEPLESRNDAPPWVSESADSEELEDQVRDALGWLEGGYGDNGDGTYYSADSYMPFHDNAEGWTYSYSLHFTIKDRGSDGGFYEKSWHPKHDGGFDV